MSQVRQKVSLHVKEKLIEDKWEKQRKKEEIIEERKFFYPRKIIEVS
jgi:hypothetical protein